MSFLRTAVCVLMDLSPWAGISPLGARIATRNLPSCSPCPDRPGLRASEPLMAGEKVHPAGAKETLLMTLHRNALESRMPDPLLGFISRTRRRTGLRRL